MIINKVLKEIDIINNILIKTIQGQTLKVHYINGTRFAIDKAKEILEQNDISYNILKDHSNTIAIVTRL